MFLFKIEIFSATENHNFSQWLSYAPKKIFSIQPLRNIKISDKSTSFYLFSENLFLFSKEE